MTEDEQNDPAVWLLLLERGRQTGDFDLAVRAKRELERLGVFVSYGQPRKEDRRERASK